MTFPPHKFLLSVVASKPGSAPEELTNQQKNEADSAFNSEKGFGYAID